MNSGAIVALAQTGNLTMTGLLSGSSAMNKLGAVVIGIGVRALLDELLTGKFTSKKFSPEEQINANFIRFENILTEWEKLKAMKIPARAGYLDLWVFDLDELSQDKLYSHVNQILSIVYKTSNCAVDHIQDIIREIGELSQRVPVPVINRFWNTPMRQRPQVCPSSTSDQGQITVFGRSREELCDFQSTERNQNVNMTVIRIMAERFNMLENVVASLHTRIAALEENLRRASLRFRDNGGEVNPQMEPPSLR